MTLKFKQVDLFRPRRGPPASSTTRYLVVLLENIYLLRKQCVYLTNNRTIDVGVYGKIRSLSDVDGGGEIVTVRRYDDTSSNDQVQRGASDSVTGCGSLLANGCYVPEEENVRNSPIRMVKRN